jgi:hypothetical protein
MLRNAARAPAAAHLPEREDDDRQQGMTGLKRGAITMNRPTM